MPDQPGASARTEKTDRWVERISGQRAVRSDTLVGGMSSRVERWWLADGSSIVTRTHTDADWLAREPRLIDNEARALQIVAGGPMRAPELVAADPGGARLAMSFVAGRMAISPRELAGSAEAIAEISRHIAATPLPHDHGLPPWRSWATPDLAPPTWGDAGLWRRAIDAYRHRSQPATRRPVLLHRDLHPLNLLWSHDGTVAVVDWVNACVGHRHAELGHLRWNLTVLAGIDVADRMLERALRPGNGSEQEDHEQLAYDPWWDLAPVMSFLPGPIGGSGWRAVGRSDLTADKIVRRTETFLRAATERC